MSFEGVEILGSVFAKNPAILPESLRDFPKQLARNSKVMIQIMPQPSLDLYFAIHLPSSRSGLHYVNYWNLIE
jgi:hypothetical protein